MFHSIPHEQLEGLRSRHTPLLNLFVNFPFGNHAMLPASEQAFRDVSCQERPYREPRIPSFASSATPSKSGVELIADPADARSSERKGARTPKSVDHSRLASSKASQEQVAVYGEDDSRKVARKVRSASQGSELQVFVTNESPSRERKSVFRRLSRPVSVFERLSSSPTGESYGSHGDHGPPLPGMIVGCTRNSVRKFMDLKIFGQPVARQNLVLRVVPGTKLFLFNYHSKELYGVYEATSCGYLRPDTLVVDSKDLLAQVRWKMWEKLPNLHISVFRGAIEDNFVNNKFTFDLNQAQVDSLIELFKASAQTHRPARRKVECVPSSLERVAKRPRRAKESEGVSPGRFEEEVDEILNMESYPTHGTPARGKHPMPERSLSSLPRNHPRHRKNENGWSPNGLSLLSNGNPASAVRSVSADKDKMLRSAPSLGATSACRTLVMPERTDNSAAVDKNIGKVAGSRGTSEDARSLSRQQAVHGKDQMESRLPRCALDRPSEDRSKAHWMPDLRESVRSPSVKGTRAASGRQEDNLPVLEMDSFTKSFVGTTPAGGKVDLGASDFEEETRRLTSGACTAVYNAGEQISSAGANPHSGKDGMYGMAERSTEQINLEGSTAAHVLQPSMMSTQEQLGAFLRVNYVSAKTPTPEIASRSIYHTLKPATEGFMSKLSGAVESNSKRNAVLGPLEVQQGMESNLQFKFAEPASTLGFGVDSVTQATPVTVAALGISREDWASNTGTELSFFQQEVCKGERAQTGYHCPSPSRASIACKGNVEEHEFMCIKKWQLDLSQNETEGNVSGKGTDRLSKKGGQTLVDNIGRWPISDRRHEHAGPAEGSSSFAGLDLNRPAFEDDDEFLEMEKDGLETDVDEFMEDQPSHTRLPMRTSEDLKPMKLLGNFRA